MEKPFYGRTGLLQSDRSGLPIEKVRLLARSGPNAGAPSVAVPLKWTPSLLTVPQVLLHHISHGGDAVDDAGFSAFLRLGAVAEAVCSAWPGSQEPTPAAALRRQAIVQAALAWAARKRSAAPLLLAPHRTEWYLPSLKLLTMKDEVVVGQLPAVSQRAVTLFGKDHTVNDVALDHPSCSAQHAALHVQFVYAEMASLTEKVTHDVPAGAYGTALASLWSRAAASSPTSSPTSSHAAAPTGDVASGLFDALWEDQLATEADAGGFDALWTLELQVVDLHSTNGTFLNGERLTPFQPSNLIDGDVITFGASTRQYVLLRTS